MTNKDDRRDALHSAFLRLSATLADVVGMADASTRHRCPHRGVKSRCAYPEVCGNQVFTPEATVCRGDTHLRFSTPDPSGGGALS
ncbi:MAG: hypothetical protein OEZ65_05020 [Gemmatimonadota bacterium]|nr:hypothetical protein [Gemmatimonadota bacterium]MDH5758929.1 hypothetical protein [Gemmatimonadota bacterium]